jgi:hypothetical protein
MSDEILENTKPTQPDFDSFSHKFHQWSALVSAYWRSRLNRWMKEAIISRWLGSFFFVVIVLGLLVCFAAMFAGGVALSGAVASGKMMAPMGAWNALCGFFLFFWIIGLANEVIRGDALSLQRLMHLPIPPESVFAFNFLLTWINFPILFFMASGLGLALGSCVIEGVVGLWRIVPVLSMALMVAALTSHLQGKIIVWISNPKTRKLLATVVPILLSFIGVAFAMSSFLIRRIGQGGSILYWTQILDSVCPFFWLADMFSGMSLLGDWSLIWLPCMWLISAWSLRSNYRMTRRYYQNGFDTESALSNKRSKDLAGSSSARVTAAVDSSTVHWTERTFPGLSQQASAIASITWTLFWRSPQLKLAMFIPLLQPLFFIVLFSQKPFVAPPLVQPPSPTVVQAPEDQSTAAGTPSAQEPLTKKKTPRQNPATFEHPLPLGTQYQGFYLLAFTVFSTYLGSSFASNIFGFDRSGFRFWVLSGLPRSEILRGRNWMFGVMVLVIAVAVMIGTNLLWRYSWLRALEALIAFVAYLPLYLALSNVISILAPFPMAAQGFQPKEFNWKSVVLNLALSTIIPILMGLCSIPWAIEFGLHSAIPASQKLPIALLLMPLLVGCSWWLYERFLEIVGELLHSREKNLLVVVTSQVEK